MTDREKLLAHNEQLVRRFNEIEDEDSTEAQELLDEIAATEVIFMNNPAWRLPSK